MPSTAATSPPPRDGRAPAAEAPTGAPHVASHSHRDVTGGWLRPAVFGAMDGLVSNFALLAGVVGGDVSRHAVVLTGLAGLAAGAFSMAAGEYVSVASQRDLVRKEIATERHALRHEPEAELAELAAMYEARGVEPALARAVAEQLSRDPEQALGVHAREELGVDPDDQPAPLVAAVSSLLCFAVGALLPVLPYLLGATSILPALLLAMAGLFVCGTVVARVTARAWWFSGLRQLLLGGAAAALTFGLGKLIGTGVS